MKWFIFLIAPLLLVASAQDQLFDVFGIQKDQSSEVVLNEVRELWLQDGKERWQFETRYEALRPQVWPLFEEMGMIHEKKPVQNHYQTVLVFGALLNRVIDRVQYLSSLNITFDQIVFLTGQRPLLVSEREKLPNDFDMEIDMVKWVYENSDLPKDVPVTFIDASPTNGNSRPNTVDTIMLWLQESPNPLSCLAISNQPYVQYQSTVINRLLPFEVEVVGPDLLGNPSVDLMLDTIARTMIYQNREDEWKH